MTAKISPALLAALFFIFESPICRAEGKNKNPTAALDDTVDISADQMEVIQGEKSATFKGHVRAAFGRLRLTCAKMVVRYNDKGEALSLSARGNVTAVTDDAEASAESARLNAEKGVLVLEGNPRVVKGPHSLKGSRIEVELKSGRVEVENAEGSFRLQPGASH